MSSSRRSRIAATLAGVLVAALALNGCGGSDDDGEADQDQGAKTKELVINSFGGAWGEAIQAGFIASSTASSRSPASASSSSAPPTRRRAAWPSSATRILPRT